MTRIRWGLIASLLAVWSAIAAAQAPPATSSTPAIDQSLSLKSAGNPRISPDGRWVAYQVRETNWEDNAFETEIWIAPTGGGQAYQLTRAKKSSSNPRWSPDSRWLAFVSDRPAPAAGKGDGRQQLYLISPTGGEARLMTKLETGLNNFDWSPDGKRIAFTAGEPEEKATKERKEKYGEFEIVQDDYTFTHLWLMDVQAASAESGDAVRLTEGREMTVGGFAWSPDGARIAFSAQRDPDLGSSHTADLYVINLFDKKITRIVDTPGPDGNPRWSPDGKQIAYVTSNAAEFYYYSNDMIAVVAADSGGRPRVLTEAFDEDANLLAWGPDGIYFSAIQRTSDDLFRLNPQTKAIERVTPAARANYYSVQTMSQLLAANLARRTFLVRLLGAFAFMALLLAVIGIYGLISYSVTQRTQEIGVRLALGAARRNIIGMVVRDGMKLAALGLLAGIAGALAASRVLTQMLFEVRPTDPLTFAIVAAILAAAALAACYLPARRAARVDPMVALRYE